MFLTAAADDDGGLSQYLESGLQDVFNPQYVKNNPMVILVLVFTMEFLGRLI